MADEKIPDMTATRERSSRAQLEYSDGHWQLAPQAGEKELRKSPGLVPALENAIAIIELINQNAPHEMTLSELTGELNISKSHCHSILKTLVYFGWLQFQERTKSYTLHSGILSSAHSLLNSPVLSIIRRQLTDLTKRLGAPFILTQPLTDDSFVVIDKFNAWQSLEVSFPIGHRFPRDACAQMRAFLAWQPTERLDEWMSEWEPTRYTSSTPIKRNAVIGEILATRERGYARSIGEFTEGIMAIALPIFGREGEVSFIFNCSLMIQDLLRREHEVAAEMLSVANEIHRTILARVPKDFPTSLS